jgi:chromosome segregation ATPase
MEGRRTYADRYRKSNCVSRLIAFLAYNANPESAERETLSSLKSELHRLELSHRESQNQVTKANQALVRHKRDIKDLTIGIQRQEVAVQDLKNELEADTPQENALEHLESELKDAQDTLEMNQNQYGAAVVEKDRLNAEQRPIKHKLNEVQKEIEEIEEHISKAQIRLDRAESTRAHKVLETNRSYEAIGDAEKRMDELKQLHADQLGTVESFTEQAESVCLRVPVDPGETTDSLEAKLGRLQREQARQREQ